jgi:hypothetical protein
MRKIAARLAGLAAIALAFAGLLSAAAAPVAAQPGVRLAGCGGLVARPSEYTPICNAGAGSVMRLRWHTWGGGTATGYGEFWTHRCIPDCALGTITLYPVDVSAWRAAGGVYTRFEYRFTGRVPAGLPRDLILSFYGGRWHGWPTVPGLHLAP